MIIQGEPMDFKFGSGCVMGTVS